jgi:hypothetical protein
LVVLDVLWGSWGLLSRGVKEVDGRNLLHHVVEAGQEDSQIELGLLPWTVVACPLVQKEDLDPVHRLQVVDISVQSRV